MGKAATQPAPTQPLPASVWCVQVTINLRECLVEDFDSATQPSQKRSTQKLDNRGGSVSLLIRISHKARRAGRGWGADFKGSLLRDGCMICMQKNF